MDYEDFPPSMTRHIVIGASMGAEVVCHPPRWQRACPCYASLLYVV